MMRGANASASDAIHPASCGKCRAAASITRTSHPRTSSDAATYCSPSNGEPDCSGEGGLINRTRIAATLDDNLAESRPGEHRPGTEIVAPDYRADWHIRRSECRDCP